ncbi:MAG: Spaf_1101 family AAA-like ATPase [Bacillota bacterium]
MENIGVKLSRVYELVENSRKKYGKLKKCEVHFHTPASYDYRFVENKLFNNLSIEEVIKVGVQEDYLTEHAAQEILTNITFYSSDNYKQKLIQENQPYNSFKELFAFQMIAHKLYKENIEVAVITDHNTVKGYPKLKYALDKYYKERLKGSDYNKIQLFLGVEISCSEKNHLVGIFDHNKYKAVEAFLNECIISEADGTYYTSHIMMEKIIQELGGIAYIAHVNSSDLIGSSGYNKTLFSINEMKVVGTTSLNSIDVVKNRILRYNKEKSHKIGFIYESDSHEICTLGQKNTWIKFSDVTFAALKNAINNHNISIYTEKPSKSDKYIKGMVIESGSDGFLKNHRDTEDLFTVEFSKDLNCIIGGRGTGKSTILNVIETILTLQSYDIEKLSFVSTHKRIYLVFHCGKSEYIAEFIPQTRDEEDYKGDGFLEKAFQNDERSELASHWLTLYQINDGRFIKLNDRSAKETLSMIYRRGYSINSLVSWIDSGRISDFIKDTIFFGVNHNDISDFVEALKEKPKRSKIPYLKSNLTRMIKEVEKRKQIVETKIGEFNSIHSNTIKIVHSPKLKDSDVYLTPILRGIASNRPVANTYLTWNDVERYVYLICDRISYLEFLELLTKGKYQELQKHLNIETLIDEALMTQQIVEKPLARINDTNIHQVYEQIANSLLHFFDRVLLSLEKYFEVNDEFTLDFNINSREAVDTPRVVMKPITNLSLGQKVVAILTFVFQFGYHTNDNTPLIIDQPEDNLDNQYIFKNLVSSLRQIKNTRQVIIVTHSSTIVTNADAEQIIVMNSNSEFGWVEKTGYPSDPVILKHVLNNLEGGTDSFKHKIETYSNLYDRII